MYDIDKFMMNFGVVLAKIRTEKGLTQLELGEAAGVTAPPVSYWETGKRFPTIYSFIGILNALGITADDFIRRCEEEK